MIASSQKNEEDIKNRAFYLQFSGTAKDVSSKLGFSTSNCYIGPVMNMEETGLFGVLDLLCDWGLSADTIYNFYVHGHLDPYTDPYAFTKGIIKIAFGMPKEKIKEEYDRYFSESQIDAMVNASKNIKKLICFCYAENDTYDYFQNPDDINTRFTIEYSNSHHKTGFYTNKKDYKKIDGKLFRTIRFLVLHGFDFPDMERVLDKSTKNIPFNISVGNRSFMLNKDFAREMSDTLLTFDRFLMENNYSLVYPEELFNLESEIIHLMGKDGSAFEFKRSHLDPDVDIYSSIVKYLNSNNYSITEPVMLCDKEAQNVEVECIDNQQKKHSVIVGRDLLKEFISSDFLDDIKSAFSVGFSFPDGNNLFDKTSQMVRISDSKGNEYLADKDHLSYFASIYSKCNFEGFDINLDQLFDLNQSDVEIIDKNGTKVISRRDRIIPLLNIYDHLCLRGFCISSVENLFDDSQPYIICYDENQQKCLINRKQVDKIVTFIEKKALERAKEELTEQEKLLMLVPSFEEKMFKWLPYTAKKWIPTPGVVNKIPAERSGDYFQNHNYDRLQILKDAFQPKDYEEMEGIVSLSYILGLFDGKESTSEKALKFIVDYFIRKGVTAKELHTTYGAINLSHGYDKNFADFFMFHYANDSGAFINQYTCADMTGELYERFDEILASRPEKRIKTNTRNKLLTPVDAMAVITDLKCRKIVGDKAGDERFAKLFELLVRFGAAESEIKWATNLYEKALAIDEKEVSIPHIEDTSSSEMKFVSHPKSNIQAFVSGRKTNCCSRYGGYAEDRITHTIVDPDWRYVTFISPNTTFFDGLVWYDKRDQVVCIDNVEGDFSPADKRDSRHVPQMADAIIRYADGIYLKMRNLNIPCKKVNVGKDVGTKSWEIFEYARDQKLITEDDKPCNYPRRNGITCDSYEQFTLTDDRLLRVRKPRH